jgi:NADH-quinone oxidoreductase subunit N
MGLEVLSISTYVMVGFIKSNEKCHEAAIKYFLLSTLSSAILLYGFSILYGITGSTQYAGIAAGLAALDTADPLLLLSVVMILAGLGFKITIAPFHMYVPDVYQGAPTSTTAFLSVAPKLAGFAALIRLGAELHLADTGANWVPALWVMAALTMILGNVIAIYQDNIKRMLAYSSIAHAGYLFMGVAVANANVPEEVRQAAVSAILFYLFAYVFMKMGAFSLVSSVLFGKRFGEYLAEFRGLGRRCPRIGLAYLILLVSLAGIPPTVGFVGKIQLFAAVIEAEFYWLAVVGVIASAIALFYYLRVIVVMYFREDPAAPGVIASVPLKTMIAVTTASVLVLGIFPAALIQAVIDSVASLY